MTTVSMAESRTVADLTADTAEDWASLPAVIAALRSEAGRDIQCHVTVSAAGRLPESDRVRPLSEVGVRRFRIVDPVDFSMASVDGAATVAWLRECMTAGIDVDWTATGLTPELAARLVHLTPPSEREDDATRQWITRHRYGQFYWRQGPGFITVKDIRPGGTHARLTIDDAPILALLRVLRRPMAREDAQRLCDRQALHVALSEGLVRELGGFVTVMPYRMNRWPIPFTAI